MFNTVMTGDNNYKCCALQELNCHNYNLVIEILTVDLTISGLRPSPAHGRLSSYLRTVLLKIWLPLR